MSKIIVSILMGVLFTQVANAFPLPKGDMSAMRMMSLPESFTADYNFEGIVALNNCSGSIVRLETSKDTDRAIVLTNGHCSEFGMPAPGTFVYGRNSSRTFTVLSSAAQSLGKIKATQMMYSTMTSTDITLYRVQETYAEIFSKFGIRPLELTSQHPTLTLPISIVSGYWKRGYACNVEAFVNLLREQDWIMNDSIRYSRPGCETIGGTSGSPIIATGTRTVVGINNTGNEDGEQCTMNNPCEIDRNGNVFFKRGYSYGQETYQIYSCLNSINEIDLTIPGCQLPH